MVILAISPVFGDLPTKYSECNISVNLDENGIAYENIIIKVPEIIDKFNYYIIHRVKNLEIYDDSNKLECDWKYERSGTLISCENINTKIKINNQTMKNHRKNNNKKEHCPAKPTRLKKHTNKKRKRR